ncbi:MAG: hypothetical protein K5867_07725 [Bacteroidales bacterium]|nr:hypothetical protein [Bacteroidales bacterium]
MANTQHNPITTKWSGAVGGFTYRILRGKQIIAERPSHIANPKSAGQMRVRMKFKLASQFSSLWNNILNANLAKVESDSTLNRALATSVAYHVAGIDQHAAIVDLEDFENAFNARTRQTSSGGMVVHFNNAVQEIIAPEGAVVTYQVVAFDEESNPIAFNTETFISNGDPNNIDLPLVRITPTRYDVIAFATTLDENTEYNGPLGNITGDNPESLSANTYSVLVSALSSVSGTINGIQTGSYLTA